MTHLVRGLAELGEHDATVDAAQHEGFHLEGLQADLPLHQVIGKRFTSGREIHKSELLQLELLFSAQLGIGVWRAKIFSAISWRERGQWRGVVTCILTVISPVVVAEELERGPHFKFLSVSALLQRLHMRRLDEFSEPKDVW